MKKHILSIDLAIVFVVLTIMGFGFLALTTATDDARRLLVQLFCLSLGFVLMISLSFWDYRAIYGKCNHLYFLCLFFLLIVFPFGTGKEETGAISWIRFGSIGVQPSEFVKLIFSLYLSCELSKKIETKTLNKPKELLLFLAKCLPIIALVVLQNDTGTALVFLFMLAVTLFVSGISKRYILIFILLMIFLLPVIWLFLADYQRDRILVFFNPNSSLNDAGYQVHLAKLALSSGSLLGKGYGCGAVNALSYLPEKETDFIFSVIGEEFGFLGTTFLVLLFSILIIKCFFIALNSNDIQGKLIATAISAMLTFHIFENIGMSIGLLPVTGIPLPFVSYGGSSALSMSLGIGLILSVRRKTYTLHYS